MKEIIEILWSSNPNISGFPLFSKGHLIPIGILIMFIVYMLKNKEAMNAKRKLIARAVASIMIAQQIILYGWYISSGNFSWGESLPLYLCRITTILSIVMLLNEEYGMFEVVYFWGLGGASQALMTPDTGGFYFPHAMYFQFFMAHGGIIASVFIMMILYGYKPTFESFKKASKHMMIYLGATYLFNFIVDGNYCYLRYKPQVSSALDFFPKYPLYIPIVTMIMLGVFYVLYLPFNSKISNCEDSDFSMN